MADIASSLRKAFSPQTAAHANRAIRWFDWPALQESNLRPSAQKSATAHFSVFFDFFTSHWFSKKKIGISVLLREQYFPIFAIILVEFAHANYALHTFGSWQKSISRPDGSQPFNANRANGVLPLRRQNPWLWASGQQRRQ